MHNKSKQLIFHYKPIQWKICQKPIKAIDKRREKGISQCDGTENSFAEFQAEMFIGKFNIVQQNQLVYAMTFAVHGFLGSDNTFPEFCQFAAFFAALGEINRMRQTNSFPLCRVSIREKLLHH